MDRYVQLLVIKTNLIKEAMMRVSLLWLQPRLFWRWSRLLVALAIVAAMLSIARPTYAAAFTVTKPDDTNDGVCDASDCSLREAIVAANAAAGADIITVPAGTYQITLNPGPDENAGASGDFDITDSITINGAGAANTIITAADADRVFDINPFGGCTCTVNLSGLAIQHGKGFASNFNIGGGIFIGPNTTISISNSTIANNQSQTSTGGAIENRGTLTLTSVTVQNNTAFGLGGAINSTGSLTISNSTFTNNSAEAGGALYINTASTKSASINTSTFQNNHSVTTSGGTTDDGGAIAINTDGSVSITKSTFSGNTSANNGSAIYFNDSATEPTAIATLSMSYNRIAGNTASGLGSGLFCASGTATAEQNWWGCNTGPSAAPCDRVSGAVDFDPWLRLTHTASPGSVNGGGTSTLTASFLTDSANGAVSASNLDALIGVPITFNNAVLGALSNAQPTIQSNGTATATFTAGSTTGTGSADATVDSQTVTANITITRPGTTVTSIDRSASSPTNTGSVAWTVVFANAVSGLTASNFTLANTGLGGAPAITAVTPAGGAPATSWTVTASTGSGDGTLGLSLANDTGLDYALTNLPFTGQAYTIDRTAPTVTINQAAGQADPTDSVPINFTVVFNEPVTGFTNGDVTLSGTAGATTALVSGSGTTYNVAVSGITSIGTVIASIPLGVATDAAGNGNAASTSADNSVAVSIVPQWHIYLPLLRVP